MRILIVGGAGYIGSQTNFALLEKGHQTVVFDRRLDDPKAILPPYSQGIKGDLLKKSDIRQAFQGPPIDAVIHFAALIQAGESVAKPLEYYENNYGGTLNLVETMIDAGIKKLVFSSTAAVYGNPTETPITEEAVKAPINPYGQSKLQVEKLLEDCLTAYGLESVRLRYFNACGADLQNRTGENHEVISHLIPIVLEVAQKKRPVLVVNGDDYPTPDGTAIRDYVHTVDLAEAHLRALDYLAKSSSGTISEAVNVGTGRGYSILEVVKMVEKVSGQKIPLKFGPRRAGDPDQLVAAVKRAEEKLGWRAQHSDLETIIQTAWAWAQSQS